MEKQFVWLALYLITKQQHRVYETLGNIPFPSLLHEFHLFHLSDLRFSELQSLLLFSH